MDQELVFVVDTREKRPLLLPGPFVRAHLESGDYSVLGFEAVAVVERKSLADLTMTLTRGRRRFEAELARLAVMNRRGVGNGGGAAVAIESTLENLRARRYESRISPGAVLSKIAALEAKYRVSFIWCGDRAKTAEWIAGFLRRAVRFSGGSSESRESRESVSHESLGSQ